jgi:hypothetical protein
MNMENFVESDVAGETEVLGGNLLQRHFVHHKSQITWPRIEPGPSRWEAGFWAMTRPNDEWLINELQKAWKDAGVTIEVLSGICLERLRKITKPLSQDSRCPCPDSNQASLK